jgi:hypothetical protein
VHHTSETHCPIYYTSHIICFCRGAHLKAWLWCIDLGWPIDAWLKVRPGHKQGRQLEGYFVACTQPLLWILLNRAHPRIGFTSASLQRTSCQVEAVSCPGVGVFPSRSACEGHLLSLQGCVGCMSHGLVMNCPALNCVDKPRLQAPSCSYLPMEPGLLRLR